MHLVRMLQETHLNTMLVHTTWFGTGLITSVLMELETSNLNRQMGPQHNLVIILQIDLIFLTLDSVFNNTHS